MEMVQRIWESIEGVDVAILLFIQEHLRMPLFTTIFGTLTHLGDMGVFWILLAVVLLIPKRTRRSAALALFTMAIGAAISSLWLKPTIARIRPYDAYESITRLVEAQMEYSFPSGHTCAAFCSAFVYQKTLKRPFGALLTVLAAIIAFSRIYVGVHYPSDILGGLLLALVCSVVVLTLFGTGEAPTGRSSGERSSGGKRRKR